MVILKHLFTVKDNQKWEKFGKKGKPLWLNNEIKSLKIIILICNATYSIFVGTVRISFFLNVNFALFWILNHLKMTKKKNKSSCVDSKVKMLYHLLIQCTICSTRYVESVFVTAVIAAFGKITKNCLKIDKLRRMNCFIL